MRELPYTDTDIADVLTFVRNAWGNQARGVMPDQVAAIRGSSASTIYSAKSLMESETDWAMLFEPDSLSGWNVLNGAATYDIRDGVLTGWTIRNTPNTFLASERRYSDFILELEFLVDPQLNSGIQIRSNSLPDYLDGRVHGYQVEIDPSERAWSAGIYDEARRGWLFDLTGNPTARSAFKQGEWNHVRIEARGDHLRTWLNGVLAADMLDSMTREGFIAFQVHSIADPALEGKMVQWRDIKIKEL